MRNPETSLLTIQQFLLHRHLYPYSEQVAGRHHQDLTIQYILNLDLSDLLGTLLL